MFGRIIARQVDSEMQRGHRDTPGRDVITAVLLLILCFPAQGNAFTAIDGAFDLEPWTLSAILAALLLALLLICSLLRFLWRKRGLAQYIFMFIVAAVGSLFIVFPMWFFALGIDSKENLSQVLCLGFLAFLCWRLLLSTLNRRVSTPHQRTHADCTTQCSGDVSRRSRSNDQA